FSRDWSSDVCSSDLLVAVLIAAGGHALARRARLAPGRSARGAALDGPGAAIGLLSGVGAGVRDRADRARRAYALLAAAGEVPATRGIREEIVDAALALRVPRAARLLEARAVLTERAEPCDAAHLLDA